MSTKLKVTQAEQLRADTRSVKSATISALQSYNSDFSASWQFGDNWDSRKQPEFETFINKYLFPKLNETRIINIALGNKFDWLAKEVEFIGQWTEDYVILDSVPVTMNLTKASELMLKRNYPNMATKLFGGGVVRKQKFTLNNNDVRQNFLTLGDAVSYAVGVYKKKLSDINADEERQIKAMLIDYALNQTIEKRKATSMEDLVEKTFLAMLNMQSNSHLYNETINASGGALGRYTTVTNVDNVAILTSDTVKNHMLQTNIANTFQIAGLDPTQRIISFNELGGVFRITKDVTLTKDSLVLFQSLGDYQVELGDVVPVDSVLTFDISELEDFKDSFVEIKPSSDIFAFVFDINNIKYERCTNGMLKPPFYNGEFDEVQHWIHYYSNKIYLPWYNNIVIEGE